MKALLRLYPRRWRKRYGVEFEALLEDSRRDSSQVIDVVRGVVDARTREAREGVIGMRRVLPWTILVACDLVIGWMNFQATDDVQAVAAALLVAGFGFGLYRPGRAWLFAILLFLAVPFSGAYADALGHYPGVGKPEPLYQSVIALLPSLAGAYAGVAVRWMLRRSRA